MDEIIKVFYVARLWFVIWRFQWREKELPKPFLGVARRALRSLQTCDAFHARLEYWNGTLEIEDEIYKSKHNGGSMLADGAW